MGGHFIPWLHSILQEGIGHSALAALITRRDAYDIIITYGVSTLGPLGGWSRSRNADLCDII